MRYLPHTPDDIARMCEAIGVDDVDALFAQIPETLRLGRVLDLPAPLDDIALRNHMMALAGQNRPAGEALSFLGAGYYHHHVPAAVPYLAFRSEFATAYTPYQPEVSQGTLAAIFEFQTMIAGLTGMEVANASLYDGASATAEAVLMCLRLAKPRRKEPGREKVVLANSVHPQYRETVRTYLEGIDAPVVELPFESNGAVSPDAVREAARDAAAVVVGYPNFFGVVEPLGELAQAAHDAGARLVVTVQEAMSMGLLASAGSQGADVVVGEGQSLGLSMSFGGPGVGIFATRKEYLRQIPGRLAGRAVDAQGRDGFVLTLSTREQHIRRAKATSNVCTNQGLMALSMAIYMSLVGKRGLRKIAERCVRARKYAATQLAGIDGVRLRFERPAFNEVVIELPKDAGEVAEALQGDDIIAGYPLGRDYPALSNCLLMAFTELHARADVDRFVERLRAVL